MQVRKVIQLAPFYQIPGVQGRRIHHSDHLEIVHLTVEPGASMDSHTMPMDVLFHVLSGSGTLIVNDCPFELSENDFIEIPKQANRYWTNPSSSPLTLLVMKFI